MRMRQLLGVVAAALLLGGCPSSGPPPGGGVSQADFDAYRDRIRADGEALNNWVAAVHEWILFINANINQICPGCAPPALPPHPPPQGDWE